MLPLLPIALALIVGIVVGDAIRLPLLTWTAITGSLLATAFLFRQKAYLQHVAIVLTTMCLGAALITYTHSLLRPALPINKPVPYHAIITTDVLQPATWLFTRPKAIRFRAPCL